MPAQRSPQTRANHVRLDPAFHFTLVPLLFVFLAMNARRAFHQPSPLNLSLVFLSVLLLGMALLIRTYSLKVQDRLIRLEERVRMARLLPENLFSQTSALTVRQYVALRFASDGELAGLVQATLAGSLTPSQIKERIVTWRADYDRL